MTPSFPQGRYLSCMHDVHPGQGGTMRAMLMRNRLFAGAGIRPSVLTFRPVEKLDARREALRSLGLLTDAIELRNIYEDYREKAWPHPSAESHLDDLREHLVDERPLPQATPWRTTYRLMTTGQVIHDYARADGTTYLRVPAFNFSNHHTWPSRIECVTEGRVVRTFSSLAEWFQDWVRCLGDDGPTFLFIDARQLVPHLVPMRDEHVHAIYVLHNNHLREPRRWDSRVTSGYGRVLNRIGGMDAFVTLTERQRDDVTLRRGATSNMFVVPNPVDVPPATQTSRDPRLVTVIARLERQKQLSHAIAAFRHVVDAVPDAQLHIYGSGRLEQSLRQRIHAAGLEHAVTLKGHCPDAKAALDASSAFVLCSRYEGYPLTVLESLARGCPVVAYDIKYGPREQITDGVDGFLVDAGDTRALAARISELLRNPSLVARMSHAAREKAHAHDDSRYLKDWAELVQAVIDRRPWRTKIKRARLDVHRLSVAQRLTLGRWSTRPVATPGQYAAGQRLEFEGTIHVRGCGAGGLNDAVVEVLALRQVSGSAVGVPVDAESRGTRIDVRASIPLDQVLPCGDPGDEARLVVRVRWRNSVWESALRRPLEPASDVVQVAYDADDALLLIRR